MNVDALKDNFVPKFLSNGEDRFYKSLLFLAVNKLVFIQNGSYRGAPPHIEYIDYHNRFLCLYRRSGDETFLKISQLLRKAAHKIYRAMLAKNMATKDNNFLNSV
jgi:hypothetical protein